MNRSILINKTGPGYMYSTDFQLSVLFVNTFTVSVWAHGK